ncbi:hypothetical protein ABBQ32_008035 [Trebouxia sp. C0010 RCD-2024]
MVASDVHFLLRLHFTMLMLKSTSQMCGHSNTCSVLCTGTAQWAYSLCYIRPAHVHTLLMQCLRLKAIQYSGNMEGRCPEKVQQSGDKNMSAGRKLVPRALQPWHKSCAVANLSCPVGMLE